MNIPTICFIFGAGLFGIGIIGGGIQLKEFSVPKVPWFTRFISFALGGFLMILGLGFYINENPTPPVPEPTPTVQSTPQTTPTPTITPSDPQSSPPLPLPDDRSEPSDEGYKHQVISKLKLVSERLGLGGYELVDGSGDKLQDNSSKFTTLSLQQGVSYVIVGICDEDCGDMDLSLYDENNNLISTDEKRNSIPIVAVTPAWTGIFRLKVDMPNCSAPYCYFGIGLFKK